jgi:Rho GDP-dissociation inhibitor
MGDSAPPEVNLKEAFQKEKDDPSMIAYLKSLGIDPDYVAPKDDPRRVVIQEFAIIFKDYDRPAVLKFASDEDIKNAKKTPLVIKEGCQYRMRVTFRVQHNVVLGFKIKNQIYSSIGKKLAEDLEMLGTYPPKNEFQTVDIPKNDWNEAPSGMIARGSYKAKMRFMDDDGNSHLDFEYTVKIAKDYAD